MPAVHLAEMGHQAILDHLGHLAAVVERERREREEVMETQGSKDLLGKLVL